MNSGVFSLFKYECQKTVIFYMSSLICLIDIHKMLPLPNPALLIIVYPL